MEKHLQPLTWLFNILQYMAAGAHCVYGLEWVISFLVDI